MKYADANEGVMNGGGRLQACWTQVRAAARVRHSNCRTQLRLAGNRGGAAGERCCELFTLPSARAGAPLRAIKGDGHKRGRG